MLCQQPAQVLNVALCAGARIKTGGMHELVFADSAAKRRSKRCYTR